MIINKLFLISKYFNAAISFIIILLISKTLSLSAFGEFSFFKLMTQYLLFSELGFLQYIFRQYSAKENLSASSLNQIFSYLLIISSSILFLFYISGETFINFFTESEYYLYITIAVFLSLISKFTIDQLRIQDKINTLITLETVSNFILFISVLVFSYYSIDALKYYLIVLSIYLVPFFIYMVLNKYMRQFITGFKINFNFNKTLITESSMLFFYGIGSLIFFSLDRLFIKFYFGLETLGLYSFAFTLVMGFYMIIQNIFWLNTPNFIQQIKTEDSIVLRKRFKEYEKKLVNLYLLIFLISLIIYIGLIKTYYSAFEDTIYYFILIHMYNFIQVFYVFEKNYFITKKMYKDLNSILLKIIIFNIVLNVFLVYVTENIYIVMMGSIFSHLIYLFLQYSKIKLVIENLYTEEKYF